MNSLTKFTASVLCAGALALASSAHAITLKHDEGVTQIQGVPQRVVVLDEESLGMMYALGLGDRVIGVGGPRLNSLALQPSNTIPAKVRNNGFMAEGDLNPAAKYVGNWTSPNLETITALKPDLIVRLTWSSNNNYEQLSKIAPTIGYKESAPGYYERWLRDLGRIFNKSAKAESVLSKVKLAQMRARSEMRQAGVFRQFPKALVISPFDGGTVYVYNKTRFIDDIEAMGFKNAYPNPNDTSTLGLGAVVSPEYLLTIRPDTLVIIAGVSDEANKDFLNSPAGKRIKGQSIIHKQPTFAPWTGPLVSLNTIDSISTKALNLIR